MTKSELRKEIRRLKADYPAEVRASLSRRICNDIQADGLWRAAGTVLLYCALPDEVDLQELMENGRRSGKRVLLPVVNGDDLLVREYSGEDSLQTGAFGIKEPVGPDFTNLGEIELVLVPGMAFDGQGHRLGRGKGYYDRLLPRLGKAYRMGVCFPFQFVETVPVEAYDQGMNEVIC